MFHKFCRFRLTWRTIHVFIYIMFGYKIVRIHRKINTTRISNGYKWFSGLVITFPGSCISADLIFESRLAINLSILSILQLLQGILSSFTVIMLPSEGSFLLCNLGCLCSRSVISLKLKRYSSLQDFQNVFKCFCHFFQYSIKLVAESLAT